MPTEFDISMRRGLLEALAALKKHLDALVLVGAQAINIHTDENDEPIAIETKDSDLVVDPAKLGTEPLLEAALVAADFTRNVVTGQPGEWLSSQGVPVDLLVPAGVAPGNPKRRGVDLPPHDRKSTRRTPGLEAALIDNERRTIAALAPGDDRRFIIAVAGPAALLVAKLHKIADRQAEPEHRQVAKDGHDVYRLLRDIPTATIADGFARLLADDVSKAGALAAVEQLQTFFGTAEARGSEMAAERIAGVGDPSSVAVACAELAGDLLTAMRAVRS